MGGCAAKDGKTAKRGVPLRTAKLVNATKDDMKRLLSVYRLAADVDFRGDDEVERAPDPELEDVKYLNIHIFDQ